MNAVHHYPATSPERISRSTCFIRGLLFLAASATAGVLMAVGFGHHHYLHFFDLLLGLSGVALLVLAFIGLFVRVLIPRIRDIGLQHAWAWSLLFFVHALSFVFVVALLVIPTDAFASRPPYPRYPY